MKKALIALAFIGLTITGCDNTSKKAENKKQYKYVCTMHPEIGADKPGTCSKCGMDLVANEETK